MENTSIVQAGTRTWHVLTNDGTVVSTLILATDGEVEWIGTHPGYRRRGHARSLWEHAKATGLNPQHSSVRTSEGTVWAHSVGGTVPRLTREV